MRVPFRREKDKPLSFGELAVTLYASYVVSSAALQSLTERSTDGAEGSEVHGLALARARQAAQLNRRAFEAVMYMGLRDELPAGWLPLGALGAFARVIYGLVAITETPPEPEALLGADELRRLAIQYDIEEWIHHYLALDHASAMNLTKRRHRTRACKMAGPPPVIQTREVALLRSERTPPVGRFRKSGFNKSAPKPERSLSREAVAQTSVVVDFL